MWFLDVLRASILIQQSEITVDRSNSHRQLTMPPKAKAAKGDKGGAKQDKGKSKPSSDDSKKLKAANAIKVRHILCEKQSKSLSWRVYANFQS